MAKIRQESAHVTRHQWNSSIFARKFSCGCLALLRHLMQNEHKKKAWPPEAGCYSYPRGIPIDKAQVMWLQLSGRRGSHVMTVSLSPRNKISRRWGDGWKDKPPPCSRWSHFNPPQWDPPPLPVEAPGPADSGFKTHPTTMMGPHKTLPRPPVGRGVSFDNTIGWGPAQTINLSSTGHSLVLLEGFIVGT